MKAKVFNTSLTGIIMAPYMELEPYAEYVSCLENEYGNEDDDCFMWSAGFENVYFPAAVY